MKRLTMIVAAIALLAGVQQASAEWNSARGLNLRTQPGTGYPVVTVIPYCAQVQIYSQNYGWCNLKYLDYTGYASCRYLVNSNPCAGGSYNSRRGGGGGYNYRGGGGGGGY